MAEDNSKYKLESRSEVKGLQQGDGNTQANTFDESSTFIFIANYVNYENRVSRLDDAPADVDDELPCPYRGLYHFSPNDAKYFFGRDVFVNKLFQATQNRNFIPVLGASGSGKSSVVLAGLVPKLEKEGNWKFTHFRPSNGSDPFYALAEALVPLYRSDLDSTDRMTQAGKLAKSLREKELSLAQVFSNIRRQHPNHKVLLIADQFEELYTQYSDLEFRRCFLDCLLASFQSSNSRSSSSTILVATMRADFLANALAYPTFGDMLQNADIKIRAMNREELSEVIEKPAQNLEVTFQDGLVERILNDVKDEPGKLPLLEFALTELWKMRTGKQLTHKAYESIGQVKGALTNYANNEYEKLTLEEQKQARRIFIQLVRPGEGTEDTRRRANRSELGEENWNLITRKDGLADSRLVVTGRNDITNRETLEVVHETLIQNWGRLREWMESDRDFRAWQERLRVAKQQWESSRRDKGSLLRGKVLLNAEETLLDRPVDLNDEKEFIQESINERDREIKEKEAREQRELEQAKKERDLAQKLNIIAFTSLAIVSLLLLSLGIQQQRTLLGEIDALVASSEALFSSNRQLDALLEGINAGKKLNWLFLFKDRGEKKVVKTLQKITYNLREKNELEGHEGKVQDVTFSPNGEILASVSEDNTVKLWASNGQLIDTLEGHEHWVSGVSFSSNGEVLATASSDNTVKIWDVSCFYSQEQKCTQADNKLLVDLSGQQGHTDWVYDVAISPDSQIIASVSKDKTIKLWKRDGKLIKTLSDHQDEVMGVSFSPDGQMIASASGDKTVKLWTSDGELIKTLYGHNNWVRDANFSPNGKILVSVGDDETIKIWTSDGEEKKTINRAHNDTINQVSFSSDSRFFATSSYDGTIKIWSSEGIPLLTLEGHSNRVRASSFSKDNKTIATASWDKTVKLWDISQIPDTIAAHDKETRIIDVSFSPNDQFLASASWDQTAKIWNTKDRTLHKTLEAEEQVNTVAFSLDSKLLVSGGSNTAQSTLKFWNVEDGKLLKTLKEHKQFIRDASFSPDSKLIATASNDETVKIWDLDGNVIQTLMGHGSGVYGLSFSPDNQFLATSSTDSTVKIWKKKNYLFESKPLITFREHTNTIWNVAFSPNSQLIATASGDNTSIIWNLNDNSVVRLADHDARVSDVAFSPNGDIIATASEDKTIKIWKLDGTLLQTLKGHQERVLSVSFNSDGSILASASNDGTIKLWNTDNFKTLDLSQLLEVGCEWEYNYLTTNSTAKKQYGKLCKY